jgi:DNA replication protein DnaC
VSGCPDQRCDGSGFLYEGKRARPCSCRPRRIARRRAAALVGRIPTRYREVSFDREPIPSIERDAPEVVREVRLYVRDISAHIESGRGIWFAGDVGTGKTTLAMLISKAALENDHTVAIYSLPRLMAFLRASYDEASKHSLLDLTDRLCAVDLLHIDDVGAEQTTPWALEQLYSIVNTRYEDRRPMVLTTNLFPAEDPLVKDPSSGEVRRDESGKPVTESRDAPLRRQITDRIVSRIYEICGTPLSLYGQDSRPRPDVVMPQGGRQSGEPDVWLGRGLAIDQRSLDEDAFWEDATPSPYGRRPLD